MSGDKKNYLESIYMHIVNQYPHNKGVMIHAVDDVFVDKKTKDEFSRDTSKYVKDNNLKYVMLNTSVLCG